MNLSARTIHARPSWCAVGARVRADPPTVVKPITGRIAEIDGFVIALRTDSGLTIAVDVEDCCPSGR